MRLDHAWQCLVKVDRFRKKSPLGRLREATLTILKNDVALHFVLHFCMPLFSATLQPDCTGGARDDGHLTKSGALCS